MDTVSHETTSAVRAIPPFTRALALSLALLSILSVIPVAGEIATSFLALIPQATVGQFKLWNFLTAGFIELNLFESAFNVLLILVLGKWIETSWGSRQLIIFLLFVNCLSGILTYVSLLAIYMVTRRGFVLFTPIGTTNGICASLLIAVKQLIPEHEIGISRVNMTANFLPLLYIVAVTLLAIAQLLPLGVLFFTLAAFQSSWIFLRFYQTRNNVRGDLSEAFAYATLFPDPLRSFVGIFAHVCFTIFKPLLMAGFATAPQSDEEGIQQPVNKAASVDAERRRQRALKALDERLNTNAPTGTDAESPV